MNAVLAIATFPLRRGSYYARAREYTITPAAVKYFSSCAGRPCSAAGANKRGAHSSSGRSA